LDSSQPGHIASDTWIISIHGVPRRSGLTVSVASDGAPLSFIAGGDPNQEDGYALRYLRNPILARGRVALLAAAVAGCLTLLGAGSASASNPLNKINKAEFLKFINCPIEQGKACLYGETTSGEIKLGSGKAVPIVNPSYLQGGLAYLGTETLPLIAPKFGAEELSKAAQPVPGGLTGAEGIGGPVSATAELAGTPVITAVFLGFGHDTAVELPIKVHLENENLGPNCYIGSEAEPIVLHLTDGTTNPPAGTEPMTGKIGKNEGRDKGRLIAFIENTLVDNTFPVPAATGCGTSPLTEAATTAAVNTAEGLPAAAGKSYAVLSGNQFSSFSNWVEKYDSKALKQKAKEEAKK
jgi:hypothetical protein